MSLVGTKRTSGMSVQRPFSGVKPTSRRKAATSVFDPVSDIGPVLDCRPIYSISHCRPVAK